MALGQVMMQGGVGERDVDVAVDGAGGTFDEGQERGDGRVKAQKSLGSVL